MTTQQKRALGRGLEALLPQVEPAGGEISLVPPDRIDPNPFQPRRAWDEEELQSLADSISAQGVLQPLVVRRKGSRLELIAGERRLRASRMAGLTSVPVIVRAADDSQMLALALVENIQRQDLGPMEKAEAFSGLAAQFGLSQEEMGRQTGLSRPAVSNFMRLLDLPSTVQDLLRDGSLSMGHGRALLGLQGKAAQEKTASYAVSRRLSVRQLEDLVRRGGSSSKRRRPRKAPGADLKSLQDRVQRKLGARVRIMEKSGRGRIEIAFSSLDELDRLLEILERG
jgi:ParB family transcriptional regulator, chromosome partitioning protein